MGKSTLIQRALGLRSLPTAVASSLRMSVDNVVYTVSLIELNLESFDVAPDHRMHWPKQINGHSVPRMDGALLLYDVMNRDSITELPQTLSKIHAFLTQQLILANHSLDALVNTLVPTILVSCKCDVPENSRQIDVESMEAACPSCIKVVKTAENVPESSRLCLSAMLRVIVANRHCQYFLFSFYGIYMAASIWCGSISCMPSLEFKVHSRVQVYTTFQLGCEALRWRSLIFSNISNCNLISCINLESTLS